MKNFKAGLRKGSCVLDVWVNKLAGHPAIRVHVYIPDKKYKRNLLPIVRGVDDWILASMCDRVCRPTSDNKYEYYWSVLNGSL